MKGPARRTKRDSSAGHRRIEARRRLTIDARCCVMSPDCIQNVDNSQPHKPEQPRPPAACGPPSNAPRVWPSTSVEGYLAVAGEDPRPLLRDHAILQARIPESSVRTV